APSGQPPVMERHKMFVPPRTPLELLENLKSAFDQDLVSQADFFSTQSLKALTGAADISESHEGRKFYLTVNVGQPVRVGRDILPGLQFTRVSERSAAGKLKASAAVIFRSVQEANTSFEDIEAAFGTGWERWDRWRGVPLPPGWMPAPATH